MKYTRKGAKLSKALAAGLALFFGLLVFTLEREAPSALEQAPRSSSQEAQGLAADLVPGDSVSSKRDNAFSQEEISREQGSSGPYLLGNTSSSTPRRVVSLSPALTEVVIALGAAQRLVGVTRFCDDPKVSEIDRIGGFLDPSLEAILSTAPDLIVAEPSPGNRDAVLQLAKLDFAVLVIPHGGVAEMRAALLAVSEHLGVPERGRSLLESFDQSIEEVRRAAASKPVRRAALIYGRDPLVLAGPGSFGNELLTMAGGENIANNSKVPYANYPLELLVAKAPEVVIETPMTAGEDKKPLLLHESTRHVVVSGDALLRPSPALADAARMLLFALHPGIDMEEDVSRSSWRPHGSTQETTAISSKTTSRASEKSP